MLRIAKYPCGCEARFSPGDEDHLAIRYCALHHHAEGIYLCILTLMEEHSENIPDAVKDAVEVISGALKEAV